MATIDWAKLAESEEQRRRKARANNVTPGSDEEFLARARGNTTWDRYRR